MSRGKVNWHALFHGVGYSTLTPNAPYYIRTMRKDRTIIVPLNESEVDWLIAHLQQLQTTKHTQSILMKEE